MGYCTTYKYDDNSDEVVRAIDEINEYDSEGEGYLSSVKWYDHDKHMKAVSLMFPDILIYLEGEGEESGDVWKAAYKNGKGQKVEATFHFEPFDESQFK